ncbi:unnamed protein product [Cuscuta epithymum]|uniref:SWIM-type domain-containing protein n=1 Tax=Cuscuta epithymum TaxID=186058 RepID=A0AAV0E0G1_9ASTE|nr:unnamed protein product [Cuscuta epithymum]
MDCSVQTHYPTLGDGNEGEDYLVEDDAYGLEVDGLFEVDVDMYECHENTHITDDSSSDEELATARELNKQLGGEIGSVFVDTIDGAVLGDSHIISHDVHTEDDLHPIDFGYESEYVASDGEQDSPPPSDTDDIFAYRVQKKDCVIVEYDPKCDHKTMVWKVGLKFINSLQFRDAVQLYALNSGRNLTWYKSTHKQMDVRCVSGCYWRVYASWMQDNNGFVVKTVGPEHLCGRSLTNRQATVEMLAKRYLNKFRVNPSWPISEMEDDLRKTFCLLVPTQKLYRVRTRALQILRGTLEQHYKRLRPYIAEMQRVDKEGTFVYEPIPNSNNVFRRIYVGFSSLRENYLEGGRPVFGLDGAFLKTLMGGCLLAAVGRDGNNQMFPLAWAVVDAENGDNWNWFLRLFTQDFRIIDGLRWTVISDGQKGLCNAIATNMPQAEHRLCARHVYANWKKNWKGDELKSFFWMAVQAPNHSAFDRVVTQMRATNKDAYEEFMERSPAKFCKSFFRTNVKCDASDNNMCEAFNGTICRARTRPLINMLEDIRCYVMERIYKKMHLMQNSSDLICPRIRKILDKNIEASSRCVCIPSAIGHFQVTEEDDQYGVNLNQRTCGCRGWDLSGIPCRHVISSIAFLRDDPTKYVDTYYTRETHSLTYSRGLPPLNGYLMWPAVPGSDIKPPPHKVMPGRPKKNRAKSKDERSELPRDPKKLPKTGVKMKCRNCNMYGHNTRTCKQPREVNTAATTKVIDLCVYC